MNKMRKHIIKTLKVLLLLVLICAFLCCVLFIYIGINSNHLNE